MNPLKPLSIDQLREIGSVGEMVKPVFMIFNAKTGKLEAAEKSPPKSEQLRKPKYNSDGSEKEVKVRGPYRKKKAIVAGNIFGSLIVRRKLPPKKDAIPNLRIQFRCECTAINFEGKRCGNIIDVPKYYLLRKKNPKTDCGCTVQTLSSKYKREKQIWNMMNFRTQDSRHAAYEHYKKNGITVCTEWRKDCEDGQGFERFFAHIGPCPDPTLSLDRIRNKEGYYPGNVRWATPTQQRENQGDRIAGLTMEEINARGFTEESWVEHILNGGL